MSSSTISVVRQWHRGGVTRSSTNSSPSTNSSHWGAFRVEPDGSILPRPGDPDPSPLLGNIAGAQRHRSRVARPSVRRRSAGRGDDSFEEIAWDDALDLVAEALRGTRARYGDNAIYAGSYGWASAG